MTDKNKNTLDNISPEILGLVSWYAMNRISNEDRKLFEELLKKNPTLVKFLEEEQTIIKNVTTDKTLLGLSAIEPASERLEKLTSRLGAQDTTPQVEDISTSQWTSLLNRAKQLFSLDTRLRYASFATITILLALLVAFIAPLINNDRQINFYPASVNSAKTNQDSTGSQLIIGFNGDFENPWFKEFLNKNNATLNKVDGKDGLYRMQMNKKLTAEEIKILLDELNSKEQLIWFAGESY